MDPKLDSQFPGAIAFIGTGKLGRPMAEQLAKAGCDLVVYDRVKESTATLQALGARVAGSAREAAAGCPAVLTCLPGPKEFEELLFGDEGIAAAMRPGTILVDHTTNSPELIADAAERLAQVQVELVDAPVSGGVEGAARGELTALVGGEQRAVERVRPLLETTCSTVVHVGPLGSGTVAKLMNNLACFTLDQVLAECMAIGVKAGLDPLRLFDALSQSAIGKGGNMGARIPETFMRSDFEPRFTLDGAYKDLSLAIELAERLGVPLRIATLALEEMEQALALGYGGRDASIAMTMQERRAGVRARPLIPDGG